MEKKESIIIKDGLSIPQMRALIETTNTMVRCINEKEFMQIMSVYNKACERLLGEEN